MGSDVDAAVRDPELARVGVLCAGGLVLPLLAQSRQATETGFCVCCCMGGSTGDARAPRPSRRARARVLSGAGAELYPAVCAAVCVYLVVALSTVPSEGTAVAGMAADGASMYLLCVFRVARLRALVSTPRSLAECRR